MADQLAELAQDLRERALTYTFLARVLSDDEVDLEVLRNLRDEPAQTGTELDAFCASLADMDDEALEAVRKELAADHSTLLLGMGPRPVSPFESVYTSENHLMMQEARDKAVAAYRAAGFEKSADYHMPEDHISLELDFVAGLGNRAADKIQGVQAGLIEDADAAIAEAELAMNQQIDFLQKHLLAWAPQFGELLESRATSSFYRGVAQMLLAYLESEAAYIDELESHSEQEA